MGSVVLEYRDLNAANDVADEVVEHGQHDVTGTPDDDEKETANGRTAQQLQAEEVELRRDEVADEVLDVAPHTGDGGNQPQNDSRNQQYQEHAEIEDQREPQHRPEVEAADDLAGAVRTSSPYGRCGCWLGWGRRCANRWPGTRRSQRTRGCGLDSGRNRSLRCGPRGLGTRRRRRRRSRWWSERRS